jgi:RNA polymerase sigma factor (sigma-70 family)
MHVRTRNDTEDKRWEGQLDPPWRTPEREVAVSEPLLSDLVDGKGVNATTLSRLCGGRRYRRPTLTDPTEDSPADPLTVLLGREEAAGRAQIRRRLAKVLRRLCPLERAVLQLRFGLRDGGALGVTATAARLGVSRKTVYSAQDRALEKLRADKGAQGLLRDCHELAA